MGTGPGGTEAMEMVSTTQVSSLPGIFFSMSAIFARSASVGWRKMRALRSPAMRERASEPRVRRKLSAKPRTPTRAATPMATERTTKPNLPGADLRSRTAMAAARRQPRARFARTGALPTAHLLGLGIGEIRQRVFHNHAIAEVDLAVCGCGH